MNRVVAVTCITLALALPVLALPQEWRPLAWSALLLGYVTTIGVGVAFLRLRLFVDSICTLPTSDRVVALTFDDGPDPETTKSLLALLDELQAKATFFCIGRYVEAAPELVSEIVNRGHAVGNHTYSHPWWLALASSASLRREIDSAQQAIHRVTGRQPTLFRPPIGLTNPRFGTALRQAELTCVGWTIRSLDKRPGPPESVVKRVVRRLRPGAIILLHDGAADPQRLLAIVRQLVVELRRREYSIVRLDESLTNERGCSRQPQVV